MSWWAVLALCLSSYGLKALGIVLADRIPRDALAGGALDVVIVPVIAALIVVQTIDGGGEIAIDARLPALLVAAFLVWRKAPIIVIVLAAGAVAGLLRLAG
jgi:branched-subunit amino acid transport protein